MSEQVSSKETTDAELEMYECTISGEETGYDDGDYFDEAVKIENNKDLSDFQANVQYGYLDPTKKRACDIFEIPSDDLANRIVKQVEYYFSDENILKDAYLLKLINQSKSQFVHLRIITSFNKMKKLTKSFRVVAYAIEKVSTELILDEKKCRVKRVKPLPETPPEDYINANKVVLAVGLLSQSVEELRDLFAQFGKISKIEVIESHGKIPPCLKRVVSSQNRINHLPLTIVEYEQANSAFQASTSLTDDSNWRRGIRAEVLSKLYKKTAPHDKENKTNANQDTHDKMKQPKQQNKNRNKSQVNPSSRPNHISGNTELERACTHAIGIPISPSKNGIGSPDHPSSLGSSPRGQTTSKAHLYEQSQVKAELDSGATTTRLRSSSFGNPISINPPRLLRKLQESKGDMNLDNQKITQVPTSRKPKIPNGTKGFTITRTLS